MNERSRLDCLPHGMPFYRQWYRPKSDRIVVIVPVMNISCKAINCARLAPRHSMRTPKQSIGYFFGHRKAFFFSIELDVGHRANIIGAGEAALGMQLPFIRISFRSNSVHHAER